MRMRPRLKRPILLSGLLLSLAGLAILIHMTYLRNFDYRSEFQMWMDVVEKRPDNWRAHLAVSKSLLQQAEFERAIRWIEQFKRKMPDYAHYSAADIEALRTASSRERQRAKYFIMIENNLGVAKSQIGRVDEALEHYRTVLRIAPDDREALNNLGYDLFLRGATNEAVRLWFSALNTDPNNGPAHAFLAMIYENRQEWDKAIKHYRAVLSANPSHVVYQFRLAWLLATAEDECLRDPVGALALTQSVMYATEGKSAKVWDLMGIIWAARGDFSKAVTCAEKALELLPPDTVPEEPDSAFGRTHVMGLDLLKRKAVEDRINLYKSGRPFYLNPTP